MRTLGSLRGVDEPVVRGGPLQSRHPTVRVVRLWLAQEWQAGGQ